MYDYGVRQVCLNGHEITDVYDTRPDLRKNFCTKCGAKTIIQCSKCKAFIRGKMSYQDSDGALYIKQSPFPYYCHDCGTPYPWAEKVQRSNIKREKKKVKGTKQFGEEANKTSSNRSTSAKDPWYKKWYYIVGIIASIVLITLGIVNFFQNTRYSDKPPEINEMVKEVCRMFPNISQESAEKFVMKVADLKLTDEEVLIWASELAAKGEVFLSDSQKEEMAFLWWKAVGKLPAEQEAFIQSVTTKVRLGQQLTLEEQKLISTYLEHGFSLLNQADKDRYLYLRSKALEAVLQQE